MVPASSPSLPFSIWSCPRVLLEKKCQVCSPQGLQVQVPWHGPGTPGRVQWEPFRRACNASKPSALQQGWQRAPNSLSWTHPQHRGMSHQRPCAGPASPCPGCRAPPSHELVLDAAPAGLGLLQGGDRGWRLSFMRRGGGRGVQVCQSVWILLRERCTVISGVLPPTALLQEMLASKMRCQPHILHLLLPHAIAYAGKG